MKDFLFKDKGIVLCFFVLALLCAGLSHMFYILRVSESKEKNLADSVSGKVYQDKINGILDSLQEIEKDRKFKLYVDSMAFYLVMKHDTINGSRFRDSVINILKQKPR